VIIYLFNNLQFLSLESLEIKELLVPIFFIKIQNQIISDLGFLKIFKIKQHEVLIFPKHPRINNPHEITSKEPIGL